MWTQVHACTQAHHTCMCTHTCLRTHTCMCALTQKQATTVETSFRSLWGCLFCLEHPDLPPHPPTPHLLHALCAPLNPFLTPAGGTTSAPHQPSSRHCLNERLLPHCIPVTCLLGLGQTYRFTLRCKQWISPKVCLSHEFS